MNTPHPPRLLPVLLGLVLLASGCNRIHVSRPMPEGPNVLLVTIDTLRADRVGAYGRENAGTPTMDGLAQRGVLFETSIAVAPLTLPSHATLLTGRTPPRHGVRHNGIFSLGDEIATLAERFQDAGYDTGAFVGAMVLAGHYGLEAGFDVYDDEVSVQRASVGGYQERDAGSVTDAALAWHQKRDRPFFLWVHYYDPHAAYAAPEPFASQHPKDPYQAEISYSDHQLGRLIDALGRRGQLEDTLVVVSSDHGESLGAHGERTHSYFIYDVTQKVPLIMAGPGLPEGRRVSELSSGADVAPTLLSLVGLPELPEIDGRDLMPVVRGEASEEPAGRAVYAESMATRYDHGFAPLYGARSLEHLYIRAPRPELYDLAADPDQQHNLLPDSGGEASQRLSRFLDETLAEEVGQAPEAVDAETRAQLNALGYAIPEATPAQTDIDPKDGIHLVGPFHQAKALYLQEQFDEALDLAQRVYPYWTESGSLNQLMANILLAVGRKDEAAYHAERAVELTPEAPRAWFVLGVTREAQGRYEEGVAACEKVLELDPENAPGHYCLMARLHLGGSLEDARDAAARAVAVQPTDLDMRITVAHQWVRLGHPEHALELFESVLEHDPEHEAANFGAALNAARVGSPEVVEAHLAKSGERGRKVTSRVEVAVALASRGEAERAEGMLRDLMAEAPANKGVRAVLARVLEQQGRHDEARALRSDLEAPPSPVPAGTG